MAATYEGSHQAYGVIVEHNVTMPMPDGVKLAADIYFPTSGTAKAAGPFPVILERTPYNKATPRQATKGRYFARRGYVCVIQDVRGRFQSEGEWYAFAKEAHDGYHTVEWLGGQPWSTGQIGTMGDSYAGSAQSALATLNPPHLSTMIVAVGASNYYHSSMRHNGALEERFLIYVFRMAATSKEAEADPALKAAIQKVFTQEMPEMIRHFPLKEGGTILRRLPSYERWAIDIQTHGDYDDYWKGHRGYVPSEYYTEHADIPTLYLGGWYDSYARNTTESYVKLSQLKTSPQYLLMGPWLHGQYEITSAGELDFGLESHIEYNDTKLIWFDHWLKGLRSEVVEWSPVRIFTMGTGDGRRVILGSPGHPSDFPGLINHGGYWRNEPDWPLPGTRYVPHYLHGNGILSPEKPTDDAAPPSTFTFDPDHPVPTLGGGISAVDVFIRPGAYDQRGRPNTFGFQDTLPLNARRDVLTFQTPPLTSEVEVTGPIEIHLWASSSAPDTDFTAKLIDVYPPSLNHPDGLAINLTDSIIRARYRNSYEAPELLIPGQAYELVFQLYPTSNIFKAGHRIRLDISSSNWPRFDVNPNTGGPLGIQQRVQVAHQTIFHDPDCPSHIIMPLQDPKSPRK
jgi:putative CocE/NonD family hydrolase